MDRTFEYYNSCSCQNEAVILYDEMAFVGRNDKTNQQTCVTEYFLTITLKAGTVYNLVYVNDYDRNEAFERISQRIR
jgi:hypothetical protein